MILWGRHEGFITESALERARSGLLSGIEGVCDMEVVENLGKVTTDLYWSLEPAIISEDRR